LAARALAAKQLAGKLPQRLACHSGQYRAEFRGDMRKRRGVIAYSTAYLQPVSRPFSGSKAYPVQVETSS
jgi:hypothetical protein